MEGTKEKIFNKALDLFGSKGYDAVSIRYLTREVGIKESSFYNHYKSKADLLEEIFMTMELELGKSKPNSVQIEKLTDELSLGEFLRRSFDNFMEKWQKPFASKIWAVVSMEQYRNKRAADLIISESERVMNVMSTAFLFFQQKRKMKEGDPMVQAHLYGFAVRAIHLDYSLRIFAGDNPQYSLKKVYETIDLFAENFSA